MSGGARVGLGPGLAPADRHAYATARSVGGVGWTQDDDLERLPDVQYIPRRENGQGESRASGTMPAATTRTDAPRMPPADDVTIRPLATQADFRACVALQRETWGADFDEAVPPAILQVCQRLGGVAAGAFAADGALLGFVFGLTGVERGRVVHWSDMLAVRPGLRDAGLGRRLKQWQADAARAAGAEVMYWTFDPLVARNAHLNFNRLGVRAHEYVEDMYGDGTSVLHRGLGTDRLVVAWPLDGEPHRSCCPSGDPADLPAPLRGAPLLNDAAPDELDPPRLALRLAIPLDVHALVAADPTAGPRWRAATRRAFRWALAHGYGVAGLYRDVAAERAYYVLTASNPDA